MPYVNKPRPYKKEYEQQKERGEHSFRMERQKARRTLDKKGVDRTGKDIDHTIPLSKGGSNTPKNWHLESVHSNRSFSRNSDGSVKINKPKKKKPT
jgi:hypothetical protein